MSDEPRVETSPSQPASSSGTSAIGWAVLAIVALLALVDIAVETFWSGSSIRWWVAPPALVLVAASAWLWWPTAEAAKRWGWQGAASWSVGCFLLLLAVSAWIPGGQPNGVRMLLQPTATVFTVVTAAAILLAAFVLFRALEDFPPTPRLVARCVAAVLAVYALASLGLALRERAPFASLYQGGAAWHRLPRWLQGSFIGAFALLPLALAGQVVRVASHLRRKQPIRVLLHQATALAMSLLMATSGIMMPGMAAGTAGTGPAGSASAAGSVQSGVAPGAGSAGSPVPTADTSGIQLERWRAEVFKDQDPRQVWERYAKAAEAELNRPGVDPSDVSAKAAALGRDRERIFAFLRDEIVVEPYIGVLRGARGTLAAEAGNALDRALLGQALLNASGLESRLVSGRLAEPLARGILTRYLATQPVAGPLAGAAVAGDDSSLDASARDLSAKIGIPANRIAELLQQARASDLAFWSKAEGRRVSQFDRLSGLLRQAGVKPAADASLLPKLLERLQDHWWLQVKDSTGTWSEFDPAVADARPGTAYGTAPVQRAKVPPELLHRFEFSLVYRTTVDGKPQQEPLLKGSVASSDALFEPLQFLIQPEKFPSDSKALLQMSSAQRIELLRQMKRFQGILRIGSQVISGRVFDLEGHTYDTTGGNPMASPGGLMGGMLGFGAEGGGPGTFLDVQVVLRLTGPRRSPMTQTRTVVRAADVAAPTFAPPLLDWSILVQPQWISGQFVATQMLRLVLALGRAAVDAPGPGSTGKPVEPPPAIPQQLLQLAMLRERATAGLLAGQRNVHALIDEPMITIAAHQLTALHAQEGQAFAQRAIDIVTNRVRFIGGDDTTQTAAFDVALRQGVADCTLEQSVLQHTYPQLAAESGLTVLDRAVAEGRAPVITSAQDTGRLRGAGMTETDLEWIHASENPRSTIVAATTATGSSAWWSVEPDGTAVLRVSGGGGQAHAEHELDLMYVSLKIMFALLCVVEFAKSVGGPPSAIAGWKIAFCTVAWGASLGFVVSGWHAASWVFFGVEALEAAIAPAILE